MGFIRRAAADLSHMVDELLDIAKVEAGKVVVRPASFELGGLFNSLKGTLRPLLSQNSAVNLVFDDPEGVPTLYTDETKLAQILRNFISNALKFTDRGEVRVSASMEDTQVRIDVADTGIGIAPENLARIFEEFEQVEGAHQLRVKGTGLGLPLAKSLAELLGGSVHVASTAGVGSTFSVLIPTRYGEPLEPAQTRGKAPQPGKKILIVDDDEASRYVLKSLLTENRFEIVEAEGGLEGLRQAAAVQPQVIMLDLGLPDLDGREVLRELKKNKDTQSIPVIINTSHQLSALDTAQLRELAVGILSKNEGDLEIARQKLMKLLTASGVLD